jgi:hypothetical protein
MDRVTREKLEREKAKQAEAARESREYERRAAENAKQADRIKPEKQAEQSHDAKSKAVEPVEPVSKRQDIKDRAAALERQNKQKEQEVSKESEKMSLGKSPDRAGVEPDKLAAAYKAHPENIRAAFKSYDKLPSKEKSVGKLNEKLINVQYKLADAYQEKYPEKAAAKGIQHSKERAVALEQNKLKEQKVPKESKKMSFGKSPDRTGVELDKSKAVEPVSRRQDIKERAAALEEQNKQKVQEKEKELEH